MVEDLEVNDRSGKAQERPAVIQRERKADDAEDRKRGRESLALPDRVQEPQQPDRERQRGELADYIKEVVTLAGPPVGGHVPRVWMLKPLTLTLSPMGRGEIVSLTLSPMERGEIVSLTLSPMGRGDCFAAQSLFPYGRTNL